MDRRSSATFPRESVTRSRKLTVYCSVVSSSCVFESENGFDHTDFGIFESRSVPRTPRK